MIKRLKWNVLYSDDEGGSTKKPKGGGEEDDSDASDSDDSLQIGSEEANAVLERLAKNDPNLYNQLHAYANASSSDENDDGSDDDDSNGDDDSDGDDDGDDDIRHRNEEDKHKAEDDAKRSPSREEKSTVRKRDPDNFIYGMYCLLCPGKRMLNQSDITTHVKSKLHKIAVKKHKKKQQQEQLADLSGKGSSPTADANITPPERPLASKNQQNDSSDSDDDAATVNNRTTSDTDAKRKQRQKNKLACLAKRKKIRVQQKQQEKTIDEKDSVQKDVRPPKKLREAESAQEKLPKGDYRERKGKKRKKEPSESVEESVSPTSYSAQLESVTKISPSSVKSTSKSKRKNQSKRKKQKTK